MTLVGLMFLVGAMWAQSYQGRVQLHDSQLKGCERGKKDRAVNALGWRTAQEARLATYRNPTTERDERASAWTAAQIYGRIADSLEERAAVVCSEAFPAPSPWPDL